MYPDEKLDDQWEDNGTMPSNVAELAESVVGRRIVSAAKDPSFKTDLLWYYGEGVPLVLTLDDGRKVALYNSNDCCAYTELEEFFLDPSSVDHMITGVGTTDGFTTWHIYADFGDIMRLKVGWSAGNPFYYGYGFHIQVIDQE